MALYYVRVLFILSPEIIYIIQCSSLHSCTESQANVRVSGLCVLLFMLSAEKRLHSTPDHYSSEYLLQKCKMGVVTPSSISSKEERTRCVVPVCGNYCFNIRAVSSPSDLMAVVWNQQLFLVKRLYKYQCDF